MVFAGPRRRSSARGISSLVIVALLIGVAFFVWLQVAQTLTRSVGGVSPTGKPQSIAWGNRVFRDKAEFEAWLKARGTSYAAWSARHPRGVSVIEHRHVHIAAVAPTVAARAKHAHRVAVSKKLTPAPQKHRAAVPAKKHTAAATPTSDVSRSASPAVGAASTNSYRGLGTAVFWALALLLLSVAMTPRRVAGRLLQREYLGQERAAVAAVGLAIAVGLVVAGSLP